MMASSTITTTPFFLPPPSSSSATTSAAARMVGTFWKNPTQLSLHSGPRPTVSFSPKRRPIEAAATEEAPVVAEEAEEVPLSEPEPVEAQLAEAAAAEPPKGEDVFAVVMIGSWQYIVFPGRFLYTQMLKETNVNDKTMYKVSPLLSGTGMLVETD